MTKWHNESNLELMTDHIKELVSLRWEPIAADKYKMRVMPKMATAEQLGRQ